MKLPPYQKARNEFESGGIDGGQLLRNPDVRTGEGENDMENKIVIYGTNW